MCSSSALQQNNLESLKYCKGSLSRPSWFSTEKDQVALIFSKKRPKTETLKKVTFVHPYLLLLSRKQPWGSSWLNTFSGESCQKTQSCLSLTLLPELSSGVGVCRIHNKLYWKSWKPVLQRRGQGKNVSFQLNKVPPVYHAVTCACKNKVYQEDDGAASLGISTSLQSLSNQFNICQTLLSKTTHQLITI